MTTQKFNSDDLLLTHFFTERLIINNDLIYDIHHFKSKTIQLLFKTFYN